MTDKDDGQRQNSAGLMSSVTVSLVGSTIPAVIGAVGTVVAAGSGNHDDVVILLISWTIIGYLTLTDLGLTRSSSRLVSEAHFAHERVIAALWRVAAPLGLLLAIAVLVIVLFLGTRVPGANSFAVRLLCVVPILAALQFPLVGAVEACGWFGTLAIQRTANAVFTYLLPALLISFGTEYVSTALYLMIAYRLVAVVWLGRRLRLDLRRITHLFAAREGERHGVPVRSLVTWVGVSSMLGPLLLYVDRAFLGALPISRDLWIYYVTLSELLIKTYVFPSAVLAVLFPWLVRNIRRRLGAIRRLLAVAIPSATLLLAGTIAGAALVAIPDHAYFYFGLSKAELSVARFVAAVLVSCTIVNWVSQLYIALLHAGDEQRGVAIAQIVITAPYVLALCSAQYIGGVGVIASMWGTRVVLLWFVLLALSMLALRRLRDMPGG